MKDKNNFFQNLLFDIKDFLRITYKSLLINFILVLISFGISYNVINNLNQRITKEKISVALTPDSTLQTENQSYVLTYPTSELSNEEISELKEKLKLLPYDNVYPELELSGKLNKAELVALLEANKNWSVENKEALKTLYSKSRPFGEENVHHYWVFNLMPLVAFFIFTLVAFDGYHVMRSDYEKGKLPDSHAFEEVENSYLNIIDVMGFSVPLLGAAILLLSVIVGPMMFINFSIPFEIKAILVLILSKTFSLVIDSLGDEYRVKYYQLIADEHRIKEETRLRVLHTGNKILEMIDVKVDRITERFKRDKNVIVPLPAHKVLKDKKEEVCHNAYGIIQKINNKIKNGLVLDQNEEQIFNILEKTQAEMNMDTNEENNNRAPIKVFDDTKQED